jgi:hypothetical protein
MQQCQTKRRWGIIFTIDVEFVQLSPDVLILHPALKQPIFDGSHQARTSEVELDDEIRGIHFERLAVRFVVDVLVSATKGSGVACRQEEVQILRRCRGEIDEPKKTMSLTTPLRATGTTRTPGSSFHSKDTALLETVI